MYYAYILRSEKIPIRYTGSTSDLRRRIAEHNSGLSRATKPYLPWKLIFYAAFESRLLAERFEEYLKSGSGKAFAQRRLIAART